MALSLGRYTKGNFARQFNSFLQVLERDYPAEKSPISAGRIDRLKPGKLLNPTEHVRTETRKFIIAN